ncbi:NapH/MauN family ferredoxin-type protein [Microaerobacter geothermalis]|uniref:NapH/MauN family ferredoxin-type protein n=1 Tax=Microaerobacter geothermalis TaxID=674972 RepID=UPI001F2E5171|nr:NapH/MauN family ferredoxin-type protein [Microaerobacter geothermalis]MCF6095236.1 NapH/MauN family ferredoxin-type protein [Microaerobacter geothermalis]
MGVKKWVLIRRSVQIFILLLFLSPLLLTWNTVPGQEITPFIQFHGSLASSEIFGIELSDPFAALQVTLASKAIHWEYISSAFIIFSLYFLLSGRVFCSWVCPVNTILETTDKLRKFMTLPDKKFQRTTKIKWMVFILILSFAAGIPVYELFTPTNNVMRNILFLWGIGIFLLIAITLFDLLVSKRGWCRYFCPLGGFYHSIGKFGLFRVRVNPEKCVTCRKCQAVCFADPVILEEAITKKIHIVKDGDCSLCGACSDICPTDAIEIGFRFTGNKQSGNKQTDVLKRTPVTKM